MHFARLAGFEYDGDPCACTLADQVMVQAGNCEECRDRGLLGSDLTVGEDEDIDSVVDRCISVFEEFIERGLEAFTRDRGLGDAVVTFGEATNFGFECNWQLGRLEAGQLDVAQLCELLIVNQRRFELDHPAAVRAGACEITFRADKSDTRGHQLFADRVNRWIGDLCEQLLEVVIHRLRLIGEDGEWRVVTHRAERLLASFGARAEDEA